MTSKLTAALKSNSKIIAFLSGQAVSLLGSSLVQFALMWNIVLETNSGTLTALYTACSFVPQIVISLFGGAWSDRYSRKRLIIWADAGIAIATLVLCGLMTLRDMGYAPIFIIAVIRSFGGGIQSPAVSAVLPQIVPPDKLMRVNTVNGIVQSAVMLLSPAVAALALSALPLPAILLIDAATAAIGIGILLPIPIPMHERTASGSNMLREVRDGLRYALGHFFVRRLTVYYVFSSILIVPAAMFTPLFVGRAYGSSELYLMLNEMLFFVGALVGGSAMAAWGGFKNRLVTLALGSAIFGAATAAMGLHPPFWAYLAFMVTAGLTMPCFQAPVMSLLQEKVQVDMMGRVFSLMQIASNVIMMSASLSVGLMSDQLPLGAILVFSGLMMAALGLILALDRRFLAEGVPAPTS